MMKAFHCLVSALVLGIALTGCSSATVGIHPPVARPEPQSGHDVSGTVCAGLWHVAIDAAGGDVNIIRPRNIELMLNALRFLEPPAMTGLSIDFNTLQIKPAKKYVGVDVILRHPLITPKFMGFDVRGVAFGPEVTNADGLTIAMSPEFFAGVPYGYHDGLLGTPDSIAHYSGLAGYKYFCRDIGLDEKIEDFFSEGANIDNRGVFPGGEQISRHYDLSWANSEPPIDFFVFNYAVYANYAWPSGPPPYDIDDFDILTANSAEAFCASVTETHNTLWHFNGDGGGHISLEIEVWDWQENVSTVIIESDGVIPKTAGVYAGPGTTSKSTLYEFEYIAATPSTAGDLDILISAADPRTYGQSWFAGLLPPGNPMHNHPVYNCWMHTTQVSESHGPCGEMNPFDEYQAHVKSGDPWTYLLPEDAGVTCTRCSKTETYIISAVLRYYPVSYYTFGASLATSSDPIIPDVEYNSPFWITADIACDTDNNIYLVEDGEPGTLMKTYFYGSGFTEPAAEHTFAGNIRRITVDDEDNPVALVSNNAGDAYDVYHRFGAVWNKYPVNEAIVEAGIRDFDYNPVLDHYIFVCSIVVIRLFAMDKAGSIQFTDNDLFGTQPMTFVPSIYIDQDYPDCHIVTWGTMDSSTSYGRPIARFAAVDYTIPKVLSSLTPSANGASAVGGAWAPGTSHMFIPGYDQSLGKLTVPADW